MVIDHQICVLAHFPAPSGLTNEAERVMPPIIVTTRVGGRRSNHLITQGISSPQPDADTRPQSNECNEWRGLLERSRFVTARWEDQRKAQREKRPPRKYYTITRTGEEKLVDAAERLMELQRLLPTPPGLADLAGDR